MAIVQSTLTVDNIAKLFDLRVTRECNFVIDDILLSVFDTSDACEFLEIIEHGYPDIEKEIAQNRLPDGELVYGITPVGLMKLAMVLPQTNHENADNEFIANLREEICNCALFGSIAIRDQEAYEAEQVPPVDDADIGNSLPTYVNSASFGLDGDEEEGFVDEIPEEEENFAPEEESELEEVEDNDSVTITDEVGNNLVLESDGNGNFKKVSFSLA